MDKQPTGRGNLHTVDGWMDGVDRTLCLYFYFYEFGLRHKHAYRREWRWILYLGGGSEEERERINGTTSDGCCWWAIVYELHRPPNCNEWSLGHAHLLILSFWSTWIGWDVNWARLRLALDFMFIPAIEQMGKTDNCWMMEKYHAY